MKLKRLLAGMLSAVLSLTTPLSSFAYTPAGSAAGANASGNVTGAGGDFSANITHTSTSGKIGIRLTLVNRNDPSEILSVDDKGKGRRKLCCLLHPFRCAKEKRS
ncbi:MAG: hypothetical protein LUC99_03125 [Clostridiales bacterium]|nr:hypothetical protein [Clostridiales bacterium]